MSQKSRKKSTKTPSGRPAPAKTRTPATAKPATTRPAPASRSGEAAAKPASHKAASKRLKSSESARTAKLSEGQEAPDFSLPRDGGAVAKLSDHAGGKLVLFFYPRADTPGCTREAIDFTRLAKDFAKAGTAVLGVSADPPKAQEKFRDKHKLAVPLLSDEAHQVLEAYGAWGEKSMYGKSFLGILRTTVLIGADGRIARIWRNVKVDGHAEAVLEAAKAL
jgi:peroxiredoxin Q/BCP